MLPEPPRVNGRRVYTETELRRIGLAYLCCVVGGMPLDQAALVTAGGHRNREWQAAVRRHAELVEAQIARLRNALGYLSHLSFCPDDDVVRECPHLDGELATHTPRGLVAADALVTARSFPHAHDRLRRNEISPSRDENLVPLGRCAVCAGEFAQPAHGRKRVYCSPACRQRRYRTTARRQSAQ